jgi:hypothetical protein
MNSIQNGNDEIKKLIESSTNFLIGRVAGIETKVCFNNEYNRYIPEDNRQLALNAGIYCKDRDSLRTYTNQLMDAYKSCTLIAEWDTSTDVYKETGAGQRLITQKTPHIPKINALALEPYYCLQSDPWISALKGKRVLIVHPFVNTFKKQLDNDTLSKLFTDYPDWLAGAQIEFIAPPQTAAGNHNNIDWQEHHEKFKSELKSREADFDIALIAAGGYGMLIAEYIYRDMKKSAIYIGGALQIFFGVLGKRWFSIPEIMKFVTDDWTRPLKTDQPDNFKVIEGGCYW